MSRRLAREMALQTLFQLDFSSTDWLESLANIINERDVAPTEVSVEYAKSIIAGTCEHKKEIDERISTYAKEWQVERLAAVDRNILRVSIYEMYFSPEPIVPNIVINEAVEIAKTYGSDESPRFINGILGHMAKTIKE